LSGFGIAEELAEERGLEAWAGEHFGCVAGCEAVVGTDELVGRSIYSKSRWALVTPNREGSGGGVEWSESRDV
jgi:hypothetical protein